MHFPFSKRNAVLLALLLVEILGGMGAAPQGFGMVAARILLVMLLLSLTAWEIARQTRRLRSLPAPAHPREEMDLAVLYHEIRNCTSTLRGNAQLLRQKMSCDQDRMPLERIERAAASIERIAREVMVLSDPGRLEPAAMLELPRLIRECAEDHFPGRSGAFHLECLEAQPTLGGDPGKLRQAFVNLFKNSFEAEAENIWIRIAPAGNSLRILIEDDGTGCPEGDLKRIFLPLQTTKREKGGMGIGLALVKAIVESHGGDIWASARLGPQARGLAIHITLPAPPDQPKGPTAEGWRREALAA